MSTLSALSPVTTASKVDDSAKKQKHWDAAAALCSLCAAGTAGVSATVCLMACILSVPMLSIIFSQTFRWDANDPACGFEDKPNICHCEENFLRFMMILGAVGVAFPGLIPLVFCMACCVHILLSRDKAEEAAQAVIVALSGCLVLIYVVVGIVLSILMFFYMFQSDIECGRELFAWGIVLFVVSCISLMAYLWQRRGEYRAQTGI